MRRKRIKIEGNSKILNKFYKVFTNAKAKGRGSQLVVILPETIGKISEQLVKYLPKSSNQVEALNAYWAFNNMYRAVCYYQLSIKIDRRVLLFYLRKALFDVTHKRMDKYKITYNTFRISIQLARIARNLGFNLKHECEYYGILYM